MLFDGVLERLFLTQQAVQTPDTRKDDTFKKRGKKPNNQSFSRNLKREGLIVDCSLQGVDTFPGKTTHRSMDTFFHHTFHPANDASASSTNLLTQSKDWTHYSNYTTAERQQDQLINGIQDYNRDKIIQYTQH